MAKLPLHIRLAKPTDDDFFYAAWLGSWRNSKHAGCIPNHLFADITRVAIRQLLGRGATVLVACNPEDHDQLLGWVCFERDVLHFCFVKDVVRGLGIAKDLLAAASLDRAKLVCTHLTADARHLGKVIHRPAYARRKEPYNPDKEYALGRERK